jgi:NAD(P)-dependent dehydrogenase (short-subunit alcohol dehydrogenase family)
VHNSHNWSIDANGPPTKPGLDIVKVNLEGTFYTWKLAVHYFRQQPDNDERDRCFIITGSMTAYIDSPVSRSSCALVKINMQAINMLSLGQLGIHVHQIWPAWVHEDGPA